MLSKVIEHRHKCIGLFVLGFNVPVNIFLVMSGRCHRFSDFNLYSVDLMCLAQGHNMVPYYYAPDKYIGDSRLNA